LDYPRISVIVTAHDRRKYLLGAMKSILSQDFPRDLYEVIVVKSFHDAAIDSQLENWGVTSLSSESPGIGAKVCEALKVAEGDVISFLEDDDLFLPGKLKAVHRAFDMGIDYYHGGLLVIDEDGKELRHEVGPSFLVGEGEKTKYARFMEFNHVWHGASAVAIRKSIIDQSALREVEASPDLFYFLEALLRGRSLLFDGRALTAFRLGGSSLLGGARSAGDFSVAFERSTTAFLKDLLLLARLAAGTPYAAFIKDLIASRRLRFSVVRGEAPNADILRAMVLSARRFYLGIPPRAYSPRLPRGAFVATFAFYLLLPLAPRRLKQIAIYYLYRSLHRGGLQPTLQDHRVHRLKGINPPWPLSPTTVRALSSVDEHCYHNPCGDRILTSLAHIIREEYQPPFLDFVPNASSQHSNS